MYDGDGYTWEWNERKLGRKWGNKKTSAAAYRGTDSFFIVSYFIQGTEEMLGYKNYWLMA